jgi:hypothetical protein
MAAAIRLCHRLADAVRLFNSQNPVQPARRRIENINPRPTMERETRTYLPASSKAGTSHTKKILTTDERRGNRSKNRLTKQLKDRSATPPAKYGQTPESRNSDDNERNDVASNATTTSVDLAALPPGSLQAVAGNGHAADGVDHAVQQFADFLHD